LDVTSTSSLKQQSVEHTNLCSFSLMLHATSTNFAVIGAAGLARGPTI